ncbi:hypothetical protein FQZ97_1143080 [compost metagenome]
MFAREHDLHKPEHHGVILHKVNMLLYTIPIVNVYGSGSNREAALIEFRLHQLSLAFAGV